MNAPQLQQPAHPHQRAREAARTRAPAGEFGVDLAALRLPGALRTTLGLLSRSRAAMGPDCADRPDVQFAAAIELDLALLADALAGRPPADPTGRTLRLIATAAHQLSELYAERLAKLAQQPPQKAPA